MRRRIDTVTSRTAEMTCMSRAVSAFEKDKYYQSGDYIAPRLIPAFIWPLVNLALGRRIFRRFLAPPGIYEYTIARTKYIDELFQKTLLEGFDQILIMGAGFDTRALRFQDKNEKTRIFELDVATTQQAKIRQYQKRNLTIPLNVKFIAIDFDKESLSIKLNEAGFHKEQRSMFVLEGLLMYLQPQSVDTIFRVIQEYAGGRSRIVFDYIYASVLRDEGIYYGEKDAKQMVSAVGERWHFGIEKDEIGEFIAKYGLELIDHMDTQALEKAYFSSTEGNIIGRVNGTHCLVTAEKF